MLFVDLSLVHAIEASNIELQNKYVLSKFWGHCLMNLVYTESLSTRKSY